MDFNHVRKWPVFLGIFISLVISIVALLVELFCKESTILWNSILIAVCIFTMVALFIKKKDSNKTDWVEGYKPKNYKLLFRIFVVVLLILLTFTILVSTVVTVEKYPLVEAFLDILKSLAISAFAGIFVAFLVDTPDLVHNFGETIKNVFSSDSYLKNLSREKLKIIRKEASQLLHQERGKMPDSFTALDEQLSDLIGKPYYEYMNESIICHKKTSLAEIVQQTYKELNKEDKRIEGSDNKEEVEREWLDWIEKSEKIQGDFFQKEVSIEFSIINPKRGATTKADIGLTKYVDLPKMCPIEPSFIIIDYEVSIDGGEYMDITPLIDVVFNRRKLISKKADEPNTMTYNSDLSVKSKNDNCINKDVKPSETEKLNYIKNTPGSPHKLEAEFLEKVCVKLKYKQICPWSDSHYTRRLKYPAQTYLISYYCDDHLLLHGQIIGTLINQPDISVIKNCENNLIMCCRNWLLPMNGAFIVMDDKQNFEE